MIAGQLSESVFASLRASQELLSPADAAFLPEVVLLLVTHHMFFGCLLIGLTIVIICRQILIGDYSLDVVTSAVNRGRLAQELSVLRV